MGEDYAAAALLDILMADEEIHRKVHELGAASCLLREGRLTAVATQLGPLVAVCLVPGQRRQATLIQTEQNGAWLGCAYYSAPMMAADGCFRSRMMRLIKAW